MDSYNSDMVKPKKENRKKKLLLLEDDFMSIAFALETNAEACHNV